MENRLGELNVLLAIRPNNPNFMWHKYSYFCQLAYLVLVSNLVLQLQISSFYRQPVPSQKWYTECQLCGWCGPEVGKLGEQNHWKSLKIRQSVFSLLTGQCRYCEDPGLENWNYFVTFWRNHILQSLLTKHTLGPSAESGAPAVKNRVPNLIS